MGNRIVSMVCKGNYAEIDVGAFGQYVAKMLACAFVKRNKKWGKRLDRKRIFIVFLREHVRNEVA